MLSGELAELKQALTSPESAINIKIKAMQQQINLQSEIITKQQRFLEALDRKERECDLVVLGIPDDGEDLELLDKAKNLKQSHMEVYREIFY